MLILLDLNQFFVKISSEKISYNLFLITENLVKLDVYWKNVFLKTTESTTFVYSDCLDPHSPKYGPTLPKLSPANKFLLYKIKTLFAIFSKDYGFYEKGADPKSALLAQLWPPFPPEDGHNQRRSSSVEKPQPLGYQNMSKWRLYLLSPFWEKYDYFLHYLGFFWPETRRGHQSKGRNHPHDSWSTSCKKNLVTTLFRFAAIGRKGFSSLATFLGTTPTFLKKLGWISRLNLMLDQIKFQIPKGKTKKLVFPFLTALFYFEINLIRCFSFFLIAGKFLPSRPFFSKQNNWLIQIKLRSKEIFLPYTHKI